MRCFVWTMVGTAVLTAIFLIGFSIVVAKAQTYPFPPPVSPRPAYPYPYPPPIILDSPRPATPVYDPLIIRPSVTCIKVTDLVTMCN